MSSDKRYSGSNPLLSRGVLTLASAGFLIQLGSWITNVALTLLVLQRYGLGTSFGITLAARLFPNIVFGAFVGRMIDQRDPRLLIAIISLLDAVLTILIPSTKLLWEIQLLAVSSGFLSMFGRPATMALRSRVIQSGDEVAGNSIIVAVERIPQLLGPAASAALIALGGISAPFYVEAILTIIGGCLFLGLPAEPSTASDKSCSKNDVDQELQIEQLPASGFELFRSLSKDVQELSKIVCENSVILGFTITAFTYMVAIAYGRIFLAGYSSKTFAHTTGMYGYFLTSMGSGGAAGAAMSPLLRRLNSRSTYVIANVLEGLCWPLMLLSNSPFVTCLIMFAVGVFESIATVVFFAEIQIQISPNYSGRYWALLIPITDAFLVLGMATGGAVTQKLGVATASFVVMISISAPAIAILPLLMRQRVEDKIERKAVT